MAVTQTADSTDNESKPPVDLTGFQRDLLRIIGDLGGPIGRAIKEELEASYGDEIADGRLYPNLDRLSEKGLVEKGKRDDRSNEYRITQRGRQALVAQQAWIAEREVSEL